MEWNNAYLIIMFLVALCVFMRSRLKQAMEANHEIFANYQNTISESPMIIHPKPRSGDYETFEVIFQDPQNNIIFRREFGIASVKEPLDPYARLCEIINWVQHYGKEAQVTLLKIRENEIASQKGGNGTVQN